MMYVCPVCHNPVTAMPGSTLMYTQDENGDWICNNPEEIDDEEEFMPPEDQEELNKAIEQPDTYCWCNNDDCGDMVTIDGDLVERKLIDIAPDMAYVWAVFINRMKEKASITLNNGKVVDIEYDLNWSELPEKYSFTFEDMLPEDQVACQTWVDDLDSQTWAGVFADLIKL